MDSDKAAAVLLLESGTVTPASSQLFLAGTPFVDIQLLLARLQLS